MASLIAHATAAGTGASTTATTSAINTTGADVIIAWVAGDQAGTQVMSDSALNTWTPLTNHPASNPTLGRFFYCVSPTTSATHTFSFNCNYPALFVQAWSTSGAHFALESGSATGASTIAPGSLIAPDNTIAIAGVGEGGAAATFTIDSGFTITDQHSLVAGQSYSGAMAYKIITASAVTNPTWTSNVGAAINAGQALFTTTPGKARLTYVARETMVAGSPYARLTYLAVERMISNSTSTQQPIMQVM